MKGVKGDDIIRSTSGTAMEAVVGLQGSDVVGGTSDVTRVVTQSEMMLVGRAIHLIGTAMGFLGERTAGWLIGMVLGGQVHL